MNIARTLESGTMQNSFIKAYMNTLEDIVTSAAVTGKDGDAVGLEEAVRRAGTEMQAAQNRGNSIFFVGNGGSAGISSHLATDFSKNGKMRAHAMTDGSVITCLANDYGYEHVFEKQLEWHARSGDIVVAISSSGRSRNILNAVAAARKLNCTIYTFSGFKADNPLRTEGDLNFYLANPEYGFVEVGHLALLHAVLDIHMGWKPSTVPNAA